jgi:lipopolysaccharide transport system permease protein
MDKTIVTYEPNNTLRRGYRHIFLEIYQDILRNRWLTYQLFKRDFVALYKQTYVGFMWIFIVPILSMCAFIFLNTSGVFNTGDISMPYPIYLVFGMMLWQVFSTGLLSTADSLTNAGSTIVKINFSKKSLVIASLGKPVLSFLVQMVILIVLFIVYRVVPDIKIVLVPLFVIPILLLTLGLGFLFSIFNAISRDIINTISILLTLLMFITPIFYSKPSGGALTFITKFNILYYLINVPRDIILTQNKTDINGFILSALLSLLIFVVCIVVFHLTETRITERI